MGKLPLGQLGALSLSKRLQLEFVPGNADLGLLVLRLSFGLSVFVLHGWTKLMGLILAT